jgi:hypothetical protein
MSRFVTDALDVRLRKETDGGRLVYTLLAPFDYESDLLARTVTVSRGFVTDFESIPRVIAGLTGPPCPWAGVVHDWLYQTHEQGVTKAQADSVFREALVTWGIDPVYADQRYAAVDFYGRNAWDTGPGRLRILPG